MNVAFSQKSWRDVVVCSCSLAMYRDNIPPGYGFICVASPSCMRKQAFGVLKLDDTRCAQLGIFALTRA